MPASTFRAAVAALAIAGAVALLAAACDGDDDASPDDTTPGAAASRTARAIGATGGTPDPNATPGSGDQTPGSGPNTGVTTPGAGGEGTPGTSDGTPAPGVTPGSTVTMPPPGTTPIPPEPAPPGVAMIAGTASASVGANATVTITLKGVPLPGIKGYGFKLDYNEGGISRQGGTTAECQFGMTGVPPAATGGSPYEAGCVFLPLEGATPVNACSPGPCVLATIVFRCESAGNHSLTFDPDPDNQGYGNVAGDPVLVPSQDGRVTCT